MSCGYTNFVCHNNDKMNKSKTMHKLITIIFGLFFATVSISLANNSLNHIETLVLVDSIDTIKYNESNQIAKDSINITNKGENDYKNDKTLSCSCIVQSIIAIFGSLLTVLASLGIFYWQIKRDRKKEINRQKQIEQDKSEIFAKEQDKYWDYLLLVLDSIVENSKKQSKNCAIFSENSKMLKIEPETLHFAANYNLKRFLENTDQKELLIYFTKNSKNKNESIELFRDLYKFLDFLKAEIDNILETNEKFQSDLNNQRKEYSNNFERFKDDIFWLSKFIKDNSSSLHNDDLGISNLIDKSLSNYLKEMIGDKSEKKEDVRNIEEQHNLIVKEIFENLRDNYLQSRFSSELTFRCKSLIYDFKKMSLTNENLVSVFKRYSESLMETSEKLSEIRQKITTNNSYLSGKSGN